MCMCTCVCGVLQLCMAVRRCGAPCQAQLVKPCARRGLCLLHALLCLVKTVAAVSRHGRAVAKLVSETKSLP